MNAYVLTISDKGSQGLRNDTAGPAVCELLKEYKINVKYTTIIPDEKQIIINELNKGIKDKVNLIFTVGGTGFSKRDITPEATKEVIQRETPGFNEVMRINSMKITSRAMLSRATSGICDDTIIINLPGSKKASVENLSFIINDLKHGIDILLKNDSDCER